MGYEREKFFDGVKERIDPTLDQSQVDGLEFLIGHFESDTIWKDPRHAAYALATIFHETAGSFQPVVEGYYLAKTDPPDYSGKTKRVKDFQKTLRYYPYFGRGYVQLTWKKNYDRAGKALNLDLVNHPELALEPETAFQVLTLGLFRAWFGGRLTTYINATKTDYVGARHCVNGTDKAGLIAGYARSFEHILKDSAATTSPNPTGNKDVEGTNASNLLTPSPDNSPTDNAADSQQGQTTTFDTPDGGGQAVTTSTNVAIEKEAQIGFLAKIKLKLVGWFATLGGLTGINQYKQQFDDLGLPGWIILYLIIGVVIGAIIWLLCEFGFHIVEWIGKRKRTDTLAQVNSTPTNTVLIVPQDQLAQYADKGWVVIHRSTPPDASEKPGLWTRIKEAL